MTTRNVDFPFIRSFLSGKETKLILTHENADPDAIGSALVLQEHFENVTIGAHKSLNKVASRVASILGIEVQIDPDPTGFDKLIALDSSSPEQIGNALPGDKPLLVIDHHTPSGKWPSEAKLHIDEACRSSAEIIFRFLCFLAREESFGLQTPGDAIEDPLKELDRLSFQLGNLISRRTTLALLAGIITDTGHFRHGSAHSFRAVSALLQAHGIEAGELFSLVNEEGEGDISRKIAQLKAGQRLQFQQISKRYLLGWSELGSFEGSAASKLLTSGCDVVLILAQEKKGFRVSGRAKYALTRKGLHLGKLFLKIGEKKGWAGGGHAGAAGLSGEGNGGKEVLTRCLDEIRAVIQALS